MQYVAFLNYTIGMRVNPIMARQPGAFIEAIARLDHWEIIPGPGAPLDEFESYREFKEPASRWPAMGRELKEEFMSAFGRRLATLLGERDFVEAFQYVQAYNTGQNARTEDADRRYETCLARIRAMDKERFPKLQPMF
jgi:hypothetical protein